MKRYLFLFLLLTLAVLALSSCDVEALLGNFGLGGATTAPATTTSPTTADATTAPAATTAPPVTTAPPTVQDNPIKKVTMRNDALQITYNDNAKQSLGLAEAREGYNGIRLLEYSFSKDSGVLTLQLLDNAALNIATQMLDSLSTAATAPTAVTLRLREKAGNLEWASESAEDWQVLCTAKVSGKSVMERLAEAAGIGEQETVTDDGMYFVIAGNDVYFRARNWMREGYDIVTVAEKGRDTRNPIFMQKEILELPSDTDKTSLSGATQFKSAMDEIPSIGLNGCWIGAAHGYYLANSVPSAGLTEADIGATFTRTSDSQQYILVRFSGSNAFFCPFDTTTMATGDFTKYCYGSRGALKAGDVLTSTDGATSRFTVSANAVIDHLCVATNHVEQHAYLNGTVEVDLDKDAVYDADFVDYYESYDIIYLPAMLNYLRENVGYNTSKSQFDEAIKESYFTFISTHRFHKNGSYTVYESIVANSYIKDVEYYGVMSGPFSNNNLYLYAPGSNLSVPTEQTDRTSGSQTDAIGPATVRDFYHMVDAEGTKAVSVGFYPYYGLGTTEAREEALEKVKNQDGSYVAGRWYYTGKMYPYLYQFKPMQVGETLDFIGYHTPTFNFDDDFFAIDWYFVGDEIYLSMHTDHAVAEKTVTLPNSDYLEGMQISVEKKSDSFTCHSEVVGEGSTVTVSTTGAGYITLKLTPAN